MDEITIGDKTYVSSKRAAKITGYAKDYVGQLCREGRVEAKLVGRNWYVLESSIREHRFGAAETKPAAPSLVEPPPPISTWSAARYETETPAAMPEFPVKAPEILRQSLGVGPAQVEHEKVMADMQAAWQDWFATKNTEKALPDGADDFNETNLPSVVAEPTAEEPLQDMYFSIPAAPSVEFVEQEYTPVPEEPETVPVSRIQAPTPAPIAMDEERVPLHRTHAPRAIEREYEPEITTKIVDLSSRRKKEETKAVRKVAEDTYEYEEKTESSTVVLRALFISIAALAAVTAFVGSGYADGLIQSSHFNNGAQVKAVNFLQGESTLNK